MTITQLMIAYNIFCDLASIEMLEKLEREESIITIVEKVTLALYYKAVKTRECPTNQDFSDAVKIINKNI